MGRHNDIRHPESHTQIISFKHMTFGEPISDALHLLEEYVSLKENKWQKDPEQLAEPALPFVTNCALS